MAMNLVSGKVSEQEELKNVLHADDRTVVADSKKEQQKRCKNEITSSENMASERILRIPIGEQEVHLHVVVDGKTNKQVDSFVYLGGTVCEEGRSRKEVQRRLRAGAAPRRRVEDIMWHNKLNKR